MNRESNNIFYRLFWIFMIGCVIGTVIETIYCFVMDGIFMNRSSVLYGPFSIVWGIGAVLMAIYAILLNRYRIDIHRLRNIILICAGGAFIGGVHEYLNSLFTEMLFGAVYWDYSTMPFNFGGRTNLLFCVYWGILSYVWVRWIYPPISGMLRKVSWNIARVVTFAATAFMILNLYLSACSLGRYTDRLHGVPATSQYERFLDEHYPDKLITSLYPEILIVR